MSLDELQTWPTDDSGSPFRWPLVPHPRWSSPHLRIFDRDGRFVVRLVPALQLASSPDLLAKTKALHEELETFGLFVPPRLYLFGSRHRDGTSQGLIVARAVDGDDVLSVLERRTIPVAVVDGLCQALLDYYDAKYRHGGLRLSDLKPEQFVYGAIDGVQGLWMVDLDPGFVEAERETTDARKLASLHWRVADVVTMIVSAERLCGEQLSEARRRLEELLATGMFRHPTAQARPAVLQGALTTGRDVDGSVWVQEQLRASG